MVDNEYSTDSYKSPRISIAAIMKNPEILKFVPDHLKTKNICKNLVKKYFLFNIRLNKCVTQQF